ncbi:hypothetical protein GCM10007103_29120 [Salinimicrobium marinum]|uniref:Heparinase II/III N-terminus n=1 Tax=Salinimicrobium marinum TaxID=680283 RepID=A0A918SIF4_9FLAO|nr:alginate lyase family protein [Salinimicrobium marinum]GHA46195.1 hypothetical protein GCM10007103_29120 [Salinimicrobium marinum]
MVNKIPLYFDTLRRVKPTQLYHQVYYRLKTRFYKSAYNEKPSRVAKLEFKQGILYPISYSKEDTFSFLNLEKEFSGIDWNFSDYGKLWTYNLNYFEFLHQDGMTKEEGLRLIREYISSGNSLKDGFEPYPISLRGINWIKFLLGNEIQDEEISTFLYKDYLRLSHNLEYHLLANHLLENGFSLLFGAYYFQNDHLYTKAKKILVQQLKEQILPDGAHYELSPMYHQTILHRILDSINLVKNNHWKKKELLSLLQKKAELMLGWLEEISFNNGEIPKLNDSSFGIAPTTGELQEYAAQLGIGTKKVNLKECGYRRFNSKDLEVVIDVGQISPKYQPGHSHADSLQFVLNYKNRPVIVDKGISTYEKNERRHLERSTTSHNTVAVNNKNSSEVWGGFRVARRAKVSVLLDSPNKVEASHDGYRKFGVNHQRKFLLEESSFKIEDIIIAKQPEYEATGHIHFHPNVQVELFGKNLYINKELKIDFSGIEKLEIHNYLFAAGFNKLVTATKITYQFQDQAEFVIKSLFLDTSSATIIDENTTSVFN